jgi:ubiquitin-conjugating enzyme E2 I
VTLTFYEQSYPTEPPVVALPATFLHPNVFEGGHICLSIIGKAWRPGISVREILQGVQELLDAPNERDPANSRANALFLNHRAEYERLVREQAKKYAAE